VSTNETAPLQDPTHSLEVERRTFVRLASDLDATCFRPGCTREVGWPGKVCDVSRGGVGLLLTHRFQPGTSLAVELRDRAGKVRHIAQVRVTNVVAAWSQTTTCWRLGCAFDAPLSEEEFQALL
jgi:hypothetical protein